MSKFFINRPIVAMVISILMVTARNDWFEEAFAEIQIIRRPPGRSPGWDSPAFRSPIGPIASYDKPGNI